MAYLTSLGQASRHVVPILSALEFVQMAGNARRHCDLVVVVGVAIDARQGRRHMRARQRECSLGVVERGRRPGVHRMAGFAGLSKAPSYVAGVLSVLEIL